MTEVIITILGCGGSMGVPVPGNGWGACDPNEPRNIRLRASVAVQTPETTIVVDTGHDFRQQVNVNNINKIDAVLYTHIHGDHTHGIDDLRAFKERQKSPVPIFSMTETIEELKDRFEYILCGAKDETGLYPAMVHPVSWSDIDVYAPHKIGNIPFRAFLQDHSTCRSLGFRFGGAGYSTDMVNLDEKAIEILQGIDIWIADCGAMGFNGPLIHANLERIIELNAKINAKKVYLTHLTHRIDYNSTQKTLPEGYFLAYDGLKLKTSL